jgi:hypothetical protein
MSYGHMDRSYRLRAMKYNINCGWVLLVESEHILVQESQYTLILSERGVMSCLGSLKENTVKDNMVNTLLGLILGPRHTTQ